MTATEPIAAIPTRYAGCHFRSRLEARWAVFFDHLGIRWEYEAEGYVGADDSLYLPDFYLPDVSSYWDGAWQDRDPRWAEKNGTHVEVKGTNDSLQRDGSKIVNSIDYHSTPTSNGLLILGDIPRGEAWCTLHSLLHWHKGVEHRLAWFAKPNGWGRWAINGEAPHPWGNIWRENTAAPLLPSATSVAVIELASPKYVKGGSHYSWHDSPPGQGVVNAAYAAARSARFEHGQSGAT